MMMLTYGYLTMNFANLEKDRKFLHTNCTLRFCKNKIKCLGTYSAESRFLLSFL